MNSNSFKQFSDEDDLGNQKVNIAGADKGGSQMQVTTKITVKKESNSENNIESSEKSNYTEEISSSILSKLNNNLK